MSLIGRDPQDWPAKAPALLPLARASSNDVPTQGADTQVISRGLRNSNGTEGQGPFLIKGRGSLPWILAHVTTCAQPESGHRAHAAQFACALVHGSCGRK